MPHHNLLSHHSPLSADPSLLPSRLHVSPVPCLSLTLPHINTSIHPSKQTPSCIHNFHRTLTVLTNSSFFTHHYTASLWGHSTQPRSYPPLKSLHLRPQYPLLAHPWTCYCTQRPHRQPQTVTWQLHNTCQANRLHTSWLLFFLCSALLHQKRI